MTDENVARDARGGNAPRTPFDWAHDYALRRWSVIPTPYGEKVPVLTGWDKMRLTPDTVRQYFGSQPSNISILLGDASNGLTDLDLDCPEAVRAAPDFLPTTGAIFGRASKRRSHWLYYTGINARAVFTHPETGEMLLEIRAGSDGHAAQTVFPGSRHPEGEAIEWDVDGEIARVDDGELHAAAQRLAAAVLLAQHGFVEGGRHNDTITVTSWLIRSGWGVEQAAEFLAGVVRASGGNPDIEKRLKIARDSKARFDADREVKGWTAFKERFGPKVAGKVGEWLGVDWSTRATGGAEDEPIPLFPPLPPAAPYPVEALGPVLSRAAAAIARKVQVPDAIAAQSVLAVAALAAQAHADVLLPYGQTRPLSLSLVTVAGSGDRKSTADNEALWPVRKRERALKEAAEAEHKEWTIQRAAWAATKRKLEHNRKLDHEALRAALADLGPEPEPPLHPFLTAPEPTIEGLVKAWALAPAALGIFTAEGGMFIGGHGMSDESRLRTAASLSEMWDGHPIKRIRSLDGVSILCGRRLSMHLLVQPEAAAQFLADPLLRDQGLLSRVLVAAPESIAGSRPYREPTPEDDLAIRAYGARVLSILEAPWPLAEGSRNELEPRALTLSAGAAGLWRDFYDHVEAQCGQDCALRPVRDFAAKIAEQAARIAGVLAIVADHAAAEIGEATMQSAVALADWYMAEALRLHGAGRADERLLRAQHLLDWLRKRDGGAFALRDVVRLGPSALRTKAAADDAIAVLTDHGWLRTVSERPLRLRLVREG